MKRREKGSFASFYRVIRSGGAAWRGACDGDCRDRLFFQVYFSAYFHVFNTVAHNFCPSFRPSVLRPLPSIRHIVSASLSSPGRAAGCESERRGLRNEGERVRDRGCRRETGGTRPAAIPRYTNLLAKLAKLARGFWNSKMARISAQRINLRIPLVDRKTRARRRGEKGEREKKCARRCYR